LCKRVWLHLTTFQKSCAKGFGSTLQLFKKVVQKGLAPPFSKVEKVEQKNG